MQPTAPPRPAGLQIVHSGSVEAAVIREARRRAWRRRAGYTLVAGLVIVASGLIAIRGMSPPASSGVTHPSQVNKPETDSGLNGARVVRTWARVHVGWVLVYANGRVLWYPDGAPINERHLNTAGLDLVRSGQVDWYQFIRFPSSTLPTNVWLDRQARPYQPTIYAVCLHWVDDDGVAVQSPPVRLDQVPADTARLIHDADRVQAGHVVSNSSPLPPEWPGECRALSSPELPALARTSQKFEGVDDPLSQSQASQFRLIFPRRPDGSTIAAAVFPVMPHGVWIPWGG